ncbi:MAG: DNA replication and repair protein RecF [Spirochaetales bacterium]|nr:DNA replication and repair protein RecF [Spirochaetales bacterium]
MKITGLCLKNFRNYRDLDLDLDRRLVFFTGNNGSGKTNILEALALVSQGRSFRDAGDPDLIRHGESSFYVEVRFENVSSQKIDYGFQQRGDLKQRRIKHNGKILRSRAELLGLLPAVAFLPADLQIIEGGTQSRRRFFDSILGFADPVYLQHLLAYNRALKQRNLLLKQIRRDRLSTSLLDPWDAQLHLHGQAIIEAREAFLPDFQQLFSRALAEISQGEDQVTIHYGHEDGNLSARLASGRFPDIQAGLTRCGPHRHSYQFQYRDRDIVLTGSQGQRRSVVLSLRFAQFRLLCQRLNSPPVLFIDDVLNELDQGRRSSFIELIRTSDQAFLTNPDAESFSRLITEFAGSCRIFHVHAGEVLENSRNGL